MKLIQLINKLQKLNDEYKKHHGKDPVIFSWNIVDGDLILCATVKKSNGKIFTADGPLKKINVGVN